MKNQGGFTLVEAMVIVFIIGTLMALSFGYYVRLNQKYKVESTTKEIYSMLMGARNSAATSNIRYVAVLTASQMQTGQDTDNDGSINGAATTSQPTPFTLNFGASPVIFDRRGLTSNTQTISITGFPANIIPTVDCIVIQSTRINTGRMTGGNCVQQ